MKNAKEAAEAAVVETAAEISPKKTNTLTIEVMIEEEEDVTMVTAPEDLAPQETMVILEETTIAEEMTMVAIPATISESTIVTGLLEIQEEMISEAVTACPESNLITTMTVVVEVETIIETSETTETKETSEAVAEAVVIEAVVTEEAVEEVEADSKKKTTGSLPA